MYFFNSLLSHFVVKRHGLFSFYTKITDNRTRLTLAVKQSFFVETFISIGNQ